MYSAPLDSGGDTESLTKKCKLCSYLLTQSVVVALAAAVPLEVNALQRASSVVIIKSLCEGLGLSAAEALGEEQANGRLRRTWHSHPGDG